MFHWIEIQLFGNRFQIDAINKIDAINNRCVRDVHLKAQKSTFVQFQSEDSLHTTG
jgi:hypothetical protein